ncbi:MAG: hypothetical protein ACRDSJ_22775 [Rubrobacteraceae bacterium]
MWRSERALEARAPERTIVLLSLNVSLEILHRVGVESDESL